MYNADGGLNWKADCSGIHSLYRVAFILLRSGRVGYGGELLTEAGGLTWQSVNVFIRTDRCRCFGMSSAVGLRATAASVMTATAASPGIPVSVRNQPRMSRSIRRSLTGAAEATACDKHCDAAFVEAATEAADDLRHYFTTAARLGCRIARSRSGHRLGGKSWTGDLSGVTTRSMP